ncbi:hypothetical protein F441_12847 [Phytophthora nicotianae CJ01A1]|uniref:M96 mating-specific protein family n=3 Tax=Phytophthora nicotianae TaxID=4792 RepID=W2R3M0_PHYN3|nr:hypothetical protein PPTG_02977 [Phytophthora nicotianae INRA-310]ETK81946.1 hypothetical protein L915_12588 [Phytophthora nicotianae]ETP11665.1 hypothetical protein F441_12847 [Phytophthora nicotianae CJ01A1]ETL35352.1 hypothetical protein L916_12497 [Phytophthora nicotianae]ETL88591.1 hypothetical protein L917_12336 [Phytophthora nicotianae]ETM41833.1 hypothetical protein L914_12419 [Phytophthora nicotianae]
MAVGRLLSPDATSTEGSTSPLHLPNARILYTTPAPKKKRVRRQQVELKNLRELAGKLEHRLEQLKKRRLASTQTANGLINGNFSCGSSHSAKCGPVSVWEDIADRQFKERARVEKQNEQLKAILRTQTSTAQALQIKAQKALGDKELIGLTMMQLQDEGPRYWDLGSADEEGIYADLLTLVVKTHLKLQQRQVEDPRTVQSFATWGISVGEPQVRTDSEALVVLETHGCSLLPFNAKTAVAACWRMFSLSPANHKIVFNDTEKSDVVARSFSCSSMHLGRQVNIRGKHTCRKYVDEDGCVTIVYAGRTGFGELDMTCQEVQLQKTGWIRVRPESPSEGSDQLSSVVVEMHSETLPRFRNGNTGKEKLARKVIDWARSSHNMANDWYRQTLSEILVEEDWKAFS